MIFRRLLFFAICFSVTYACYCQGNKKWDVNNTSAPYKEVSFTVNEGTWMNLDVSPDGKEIVFDLLGDIYLLPVAGGEAKPLRQGLAMEVQPRFSPDGKQILFTSDAGGGDNIWIMEKDGSKARQVTKENFRLLNNAVWTPDGQYIIARKHFTATRSLGAGEMWMYHITGGNGIQLTARKNDQQDVNEPAMSPDGRYVYFSEDMYPGGMFQYNKDPNNEIFVIRRFDREKGVIENITGGPGGAFRPQVSPDGKTLAFVKRVRTKTVLYLRDLATGEERPVYDKLSKDQEEAWSIFGVYTGYAWLPDNKQLIVWANGRINRIIADGTNSSTEIPFTCNVKQRVTEAVRYRQNFNQDNFNVNVIRQARTSPDGKWLVFNAVGYLWKKALPDGKPERVTIGSDFEFEPAFSKDGKSIIFTTWNDTATGAILKVSFPAKSKPVKLTPEKGIYRSPSFSSDDKRIVFLKEGGNNALGNGFSAQPGVYIMSAQGGPSEFINSKGRNPVFVDNDKRIAYESARSYGSYKTDGSDDRTIFKSTYGSQFIPSPDQKWVAFVDLHKVYIASFVHTGKTVDLGATSTDFPVKQVARDAGINLHWSGNGKQLHYTLGDQYYTINVEDRFEFAGGKADSLFKIPERGLSVGLEVKSDKPSGVTAFTNARIITMKGNEVIEDGVIIIENNIIKAIGSSTALNIPAGALTIDCKGKTIMPGMVDGHAHGSHFRDGLTPQKHWPYFANLAYGVTTMHDPSANSEMVFTQSEMVRAGYMIGPRVFSTGTVLYGADGATKAVINSIDDARSALRRSKAYGAFSVKSYNQPRREQNQMILQAARELGMEVVPEGGSFYFHNLGMILDGHTTIEHNIPVAVLHDDVIQLWKNSKTAYTPTLIVCFGAMSGEYYWYQHTNVWENKKLLNFFPRDVIDVRSRQRTMVPEEEYENGHILVSKSVKRLQDAGVIINMGAHGQIQGIGAHWETWMLQQGGMSNHEALRAATYNSAWSLGLDSLIGSLEPGKLADLVVMAKNPLDNIRNTESIQYVMVNGRLYDTETMNQVGNSKKLRDKFFWEMNRNPGVFDWHEETESEGCSCGRH
jgi:imidazolonepropionase-like amidohydrolase/Tol biopolymer transport system component